MCDGVRTGLQMGFALGQMSAQMKYLQMQAYMGQGMFPQSCIPGMGNLMPSIFPQVCMPGMMGQIPGVPPQIFPGVPQQACMPSMGNPSIFPQACIPSAMGQVPAIPAPIYPGVAPQACMPSPQVCAPGMTGQAPPMSPGIPQQGMCSQPPMYPLPQRGNILGQGVTPIERGANAGRIVSDLNSKGRQDILGNSNVEYMNYDQNTQKLSLDSGLAYSKESLRSLDKDGNGIVSVQEAGPLGEVLDINQDGIISAGENLAYTMLQDSNMDGIVTPEEVQNGTNMLQNRELAQSKLRSLFDGHNMEARERDFNITQYGRTDVSQFQRCH